MTPRPALALTLLLALLLSGCTGPGTPQAGEPPHGFQVPCPPGTPADPVDAIVRTSMGNVTLRLATDGAPNTTANFVKLARDGVYDGVLFHRIIGPSPDLPDGFMVQTGDPSTKDPSTPPEQWGTGGTDVIRDEFHPDLQHDAAGVVSMANAGPNSGSSQFFITLAPTRHLDGRHAVFGHVVDGMDVVRALGNVSTNGDGQPGTTDDDRPVDPPKILGVDIVDAPVEHAVHAKAILDHKTVHPGGNVSFLVLGFNDGTVRDRVTFAVEAPNGWQPSAPDVACADLIPGAARVSVVTLQVPEGFTGDATATLRLTGSDNATDEVPLRVTVAETGAQAVRGSRVQGNYVGVLEDGRLFDTSLLDVARDDGIPKATSFRMRAPSQYSPFPFTVGSGVIEGFSKLATGAREGETPAGRIPPEEAYGATAGGHPLSGKTLLFELEVVAVS